MGEGGGRPEAGDVGEQSLDGGGLGGDAGGEFGRDVEQAGIHDGVRFRRGGGSGAGIRRWRPGRHR